MHIEPRKMLVVEDEALVAMLVEDALVDAGFGVMGPAATVEEAMALLARERPDAVVLDLDGVTFIDCTGLSAVLACEQELSAAGRQLVLRSTSAAVRRLLDLTGVAGRFEQPITPTAVPAPA